MRNIDSSADVKKIERAIVVAFHKYTPFGGEFYEPLLDFFLKKMQEYEDEYDMIYIIDSTWDIDPKRIENMKAKIIKVDPSLRYYDAYKKVLPEIKEYLVLFMDNDMLVYKKGLIDKTFNLLLDEYDVVSIYDTIGTYATDKMNGKNKFCPYWFATGTIMLADFLEYEWGPNMPEHETLGKLTEEMIKDNVKCYEWEEDKSEATFENGEVKTEKNLGYYHIRAGSTIAYLLATKKYGDRKTYDDYIQYQPHSEIVRHCQWYAWIGGDPKEIYDDL